MPEYGWVWRDSKTINGTTGYLVYQVPNSSSPIRTRDGFAIPWHSHHRETNVPDDPAVELKLENRVAIKDLIEEDWEKTKSRVNDCGQTMKKLQDKMGNVNTENSQYYGFILDTTELVNEHCLAVKILFDVSS